MLRIKPSYSQSFIRLLICTFIETTLLRILLIVETWYVVAILNNKAQLGLIMIASAVPRLAFMAIGGGISDRFPKAKIIFFTFSVRMAVMAIAAILFWIGAMSVWKLAAISIMSGMLDAFFWPARDSLLPSVIDIENLPKANSIMQASNQAGFLLGPIIGGILLSSIPIFKIYIIAALAMLAGIFLINSVVENGHDKKSKEQSLSDDLKEAANYVLYHPILRPLLTIYVFANLLFIGPLVLGIPALVTDHLHGSAKELSYLQTAIACGMTIGFVLQSFIQITKKRMMAIAVLIALEGVLIALEGVVHSLAIAISLQFILGLCIAYNNIPMISLVQQHTDKEKLGRVMGLNTAFSMGLYPVSYALVSMLFSLDFKVETVMPTFGIILLAAMLSFILFSKIVQKAN